MNKVLVVGSLNMDFAVLVELRMKELQAQVDEYG